MRREGERESRRVERTRREKWRSIKEIIRLGQAYRPPDLGK